jgi:hypothetical protein
MKVRGVEGCTDRRESDVFCFKIPKNENNMCSYDALRQYPMTVLHLFQRTPYLDYIINDSN